MPRPRVSLCTFTYNDGELADGLLAESAGWSVRPDEIVIVDDGSSPPYVPASPPPGCRVLRQPANIGITRTKHEGVSALTGDALAAMDCDARPGLVFGQFDIPLSERAPDLGRLAPFFRLWRGLPGRTGPWRPHAPCPGENPR
jgi:glycosyltransferase involved in cell wall biosynthesis